MKPSKSSWSRRTRAGTRRPSTTSSRYTSTCSSPSSERRTRWKTCGKRGQDRRKSIYARIRTSPGLKLGTLSVSSKAFGQHGKIPRQYTGEGDNRSPPIEWKGVPQGTRQLALVCHDPDAPLPDGFTHWVVYGIPEGGGQSLVQGLNGAGRPGYIGPAPPPGHGLHHYYFWLYALGDATKLAPNLSREALLSTIGKNVTEQARLVGTYER